jgi:hypothetical protein
MRRGTAALILLCALAGSWAAAARADMIPSGYAGPVLASGTSSDYLDISQLAFNPGDPDHLYATRFAFGQSSSVVTRYDYSPATGRISNPVTVATISGGSIGLAFLNNNLYVSSNNLTTNLGGITRLTPNGDGTYGSPVQFINNIPIGDHQVDQLQIHGNTLYVGIGTQTDQGINNTQGVKESVYNGTIGVISDLTKANITADGSDNLALSSVLTDTDPGKLHVYASGFRNPFGLLVTPAGQVVATDNGQDSPVTPDYLYKGLVQGDKGLFPTDNPGNSVQPLANLGLHTAATGPAVIPLGGDQGDFLVGLFHHDPDNPSFTLGNDVVMVDSTTGAVTPAITSLTSVTDIITDPSGRILIADYGPNFDNGGNPNSGGIYELNPVPEPSTLALLLLGLTVVGASRKLAARSRAAPRE